MREKEGRTERLRDNKTNTDWKRESDTERRELRQERERG